MRLESLSTVSQQPPGFWEIEIARQWPCESRLIEAQQHRTCDNLSDELSSKLPLSMIEEPR